LPRHTPSPSASTKTQGRRRLETLYKIARIARHIVWRDLLRHGFIRIYGVERMNIVIETERLILKNYTESDLKNVYRLKSEPLVWKYSTKTASDNIEDAKNYLLSLLKNYDENKYNFQALFLKDTREYIGEAGVLSFNKEKTRAVVGYNLLPQYWKNGYATEITKALVKYLFEEEKVERVEGLVGEDNIASRKVLEKSGFKIEGLLRHFAYINKEFVNVYYYGIIKSDFQNDIYQNNIC
jgi:ribosomal-protein-alanine N-acetyltransferase